LLGVVMAMKHIPIAVLAAALLSCSVAGAIAASATDPQTTSGIINTVNPTGLLQSGLDALKAKDITRARALRDSLPAGSLDQHILEWAVALSGERGVPSGEIAAAAYNLPGWPGMAALRRNSERAMFLESPAPQKVLSAFGDTQAQSAKGAIILARAHVAMGNAKAARRALSHIWRTSKLELDDEQAIIDEFSKVLSRDDHRVRMEQMMFDERIASAGRVAALAGAAGLFKAWVAVSKGDKNAAELLNNLPAAQQKSPAYLFARAQYLRKAEKWRDAAKTIMKAPADANLLVDPDAWWNERRIIARGLIDIGDAKHAYSLSAGHSAESSSGAAEAEFHAGWIALRALNEPGIAAKHFARIVEISSRPSSASRGYYWLGRAAEASGDSAQDYYRRAAHFGTTFYGQLAAAKLGNDKLEVPYPKPTAGDRAAFERVEAVAAIRRLNAIGHQNRANALYFALAEEMESVGQLALLAAMAEKQGNHFLALKVGKIAANRGLDVGALAHPTGVIPASANISGSGKALAYAIARQESEFNAGAVSKAGALGLLQLMPATAKEVAGRNGMKYDKARLTMDAAYNATLGAHFLGEQIDRFDGSYILTFIGYNAGPRRAEQWIEKDGDPRGKNVDLDRTNSIH
jgi:soluble lytic murein transglycosylase